MVNVAVLWGWRWVGVDYRMNGAVFVGAFGVDLALFRVT